MTTCRESWETLSCICYYFCEFQKMSCVQKPKGQKCCALSCFYLRVPSPYNTIATLHLRRKFLNIFYITRQHLGIHTYHIPMLRDSKVLASNMLYWWWKYYDPILVKYQHTVIISTVSFTIMYQFPVEEFKTKMNSSCIRLSLVYLINWY